ncbi:hypothetical protein [Arsenophonus endosymbiont of Aleurodicus floccissimus]|uniref:hypothetical protein n=1 Tax=Arsenophonus endosymbiont of Aleurodicus floccissimus TaxID=2152761 RepID=UPI001604391D|nr:hypothetical protein [Arsenophonus endosymbiont of Aleurodicus floccissimus]
MPSKILITSYNISSFGGMETICREFILLLKQRRPDITVSFVFFLMINKRNQMMLG